MVKVAEDHCPAALPQAREIEKKFSRLFSLYGACHKIYNANYTSDANIDKLSKLVNVLTLSNPLITFKKEDKRVHDVL